MSPRTQKSTNYCCTMAPPASPAKKPEQLTIYLPDQVCNSPYCQPYNSYNVSSESLVLDQLIIPKLIIFYILITYLVDFVEIL